jgi:hypothetical protein
LLANQVAPEIFQVVYIGMLWGIDVTNKLGKDINDQRDYRVFTCRKNEGFKLIINYVNRTNCRIIFVWRKCILFVT